MSTNKEILIYEDPEVVDPVRVTLKGETVWLTQRQMSELFDSSSDNIGLHLKNIYADKELEQPATTEDFSVVRIEGSREVVRRLKHYNLDAIISVGYRVNSRRGVRFRQWASSILKEHLVAGYTFNQARLAEKGLLEARQSLELLSKTLEVNALVNDTGKAILTLIREYAKTWRMLLEYDEDTLSLPEDCRPPKGSLAYRSTVNAIAQLKKDLMQRGEATSLFGQERDTALAGILGNIEQTMFGENLYKSSEERAAHLLYFIIKDHPFADGNKRIGSFLFLLYLQQQGMTLRIDTTALTALALLIAESSPSNKDLLIRLIVNLLHKS